MNDIKLSRRNVLKSASASLLFAGWNYPIVAYADVTDTDTRNDKIAKEAFINSVIYHSRKDNNARNIRILKGLQSLAETGNADAINNALSDPISPVDVVDDVKNIINLGTVVPGAIGKTAKGIKNKGAFDLLDSGARVLERYFPQEDQGRFTDKVAYESRVLIEYLWDRSKDDPELQKELNKYLPSELGKFGNSFEEILGASSDFADSVKINQLIGIAQRQDKILSSQADNEAAIKANKDEIIRAVKDSTDEIKKTIEDLLSKPPEQIEYEDTIKKIGEYETYGRLATELLKFIDEPEAAKTIGIAVSGYSQFTKITAAFNAKDMGLGLATTNYALIAIGIVNAFSDSGPTELDIMMDAFAQLQDYIKESTELVLNRLDELDDRLIDIQYSLSEMYQEILNQGRDIRDLHVKVDDLEELFIRKADLLFNATRAGFERELTEAIVDAVGHKDIWEAGAHALDREEYAQLLTTLYTHAVFHSSDALSIGRIASQEFGPEDLMEQMGATNFVASIPYLSRAFNITSGGNTPIVSIDPAMWTLSTATLLDLIGDWPEYQEGLKVDFLQAVKQSGETLEDYLNAMHPKNSLESSKFIISAADHIASSYYDAAKAGAIKIFERKLFYEGHTRPTDYTPPDWNNFTYNDLANLFEIGTMGIENDDVKVFVTHGRQNPIQYMPPLIGGGAELNGEEIAQQIRELISQDIKLALWFGAKLEIHFQTSSFGNDFYGKYVNQDLNLQLKLPSEEEKIMIWSKKAEKIEGNAIVYLASRVRDFLQNKYGENSNQELVAQGQEKLNDFIQRRSLRLFSEISDEMNVDASILSKHQKKKESHEGLLELSWRSLVLGSQESEYRNLEDYFIGGEYPNLSIEGLFVSKTLNDMQSETTRKHTEIQSRITEIAENPAEKPNLLIADTSPLAFDTTMNRLRECIATLESGETWRTPYGSQRSLRL